MPPWAERRLDETAWAWWWRIVRDIRSSERIVEIAWQAKAQELAWLRESMTADGIPEHIQALVIQQW